LQHSVLIGLYAIAAILGALLAIAISFSGGVP
jgi:hypothetical protein